MINVLSLTHLTALDWHCSWRWGHSFSIRLQFPECNSSQKAGQQRKYRWGKFLLLPQVVGRGKKKQSSLPEQEKQTRGKMQKQKEGATQMEETSAWHLSALILQEYFVFIFIYSPVQEDQKEWDVFSLCKVGQHLRRGWKEKQNWGGFVSLRGNEGDWIIWGTK